MSITAATAIGLIVAFVVSFVIVFFMIGALGLSRRRAASMAQIPRVGEIWTQDGETLQIRHTTPNNIKLRIVSSDGIDEWDESWEEWFKRCQHRTILRTGFRWDDT